MQPQNVQQTLAIRGHFEPQSTHKPRYHRAPQYSVIQRYVRYNAYVPAANNGFGLVQSRVGDVNLRATKNIGANDCLHLFSPWGKDHQSMLLYEKYL